jgi:hypothetical protein
VSRHRKQKAAESIPTAPGPAALPLNEPAQVENDARTQSRFRLALVLAGIWWVALITLVLTTANPVVVNFRQIESSDYVVTARIVDRTTGRIEVARDWERRPELRTLEGELTVPNLPKLQDGREYVVPLQSRRGTYSVTEPRTTTPMAVVYPADPKTTEQLERVLGEVHRAESPPPPG